MERFTPLVLLCLAALVQSIKVDSQPSAKDVTQGKYYNGGYMGTWGWYHHYCMACMMNQCPSWCYSWNNPMMNNVVMPTTLPNAVQIKSSGRDASRTAHYWPHHEMRHVTGGGWYSPDRDSEWDYDSRDSDWDNDRRGDSFDRDYDRAHFDRDHYDRVHFDRDFYDDDYDMMDYHHCWNCNQRNCPHWCYDQDDWDYDGQPGAYDSDYEFCRRWDCQRNECPRWCYEDERIIRHLAQSRIVNDVQSAVAEAAAAAKPAAVAAVTAAAAQWWPGWYRHYCMNCMMNQCPSYCYSSYPYTSATTVMMPLKHRSPLLKIKGQTRDVSKVVDRWHHLSPYEHRGWYPRDDNDYNYGYYHDDYDYDYDYDYDDYNNWDDCQYCSGYHCPGWCFNRMVRNFIQTTEGVATNAGNGNWWYYQRYCMSCTMYGCPDWCRRHWGYYYPWRM